MSDTLFIIHTTPVTVASLNELAKEMMPTTRVFNIVDDSILPQLQQNGADLTEIEERWFFYAQTAAKQGADCVLSACSSVGELADRAQAQLPIPVLRIDSAMAEKALTFGPRIGVAATLATTLGPTTRLLEQSAARSGREVTIHPVLVDEAYRQLQKGDVDAHDRVLLDALFALRAQVDVVVLAQASMARAVANLPAHEQAYYLTSPRLGMARVQQIMAQQAAEANP
ncbi:aspartate/glutamate racemase family protein [Alicyclobacillus fodiniaquatilis]|jgi:Asp/Glu/hydantoin racemase|uniref:Aspartate/glutamate racemase family protein n=1 Tax=Alicyclobacillus fodiniaquatilis TaxID=1661150 RepID=A0ABW4JP57_9BACL